MMLGSGGGGPGRPLKCLACDLWSSSYDYWLSHLTSDSHQDKVGNAKNNSFSHEAWIEEADSCLKVTEVKDINVQSLVSYLVKFGTLLDLIKQQDERNTEFYFIKFDSPDPVVKILSAQKKAPHQVQGRQIFFSRKYENNSAASALGSPTKGSNSLMSNNGIGNNVEQLSGIGLLASEYWDANETDGTALGSLQTMYNDDDDNPSAGLPQVIENTDYVQAKVEKSEDYHDMFSTKMIEHLANNLSDMSLEDQLEGFCKNILLTEPFLEGRSKLEQELLTMIKVMYPKSNLYPFGMDYIGIGNSDDPVNLYVDLFDNVLSAHKQPDETNSTQNFTDVFQFLKGEAENLRFCSKLSKTMDRIRFYHIESGLKVTLRFSGYAVVREGILIKFLCTLDPRVRPLLALARYWSATNTILDSLPENDDNRGRLLVLLMIFHLSNRKVIPTLAKLQSQPCEKVVHAGVDFSFCTDPSKLPPPNTLLIEDKSIMTLSAMSLLQDFFERFGLASLKENAVSLWYAKFMKKDHLIPQNQHNLPDDFTTKLRFGINGEILKQSLNIGDTNHQFCVQDFFDLSLNIGLSVDGNMMSKFQKTAWKTGEKLERILNSNSPSIMTMFLTTAEDERIEKEKDDERKKEFQEMHKQVQQEQQRLLELKQKKEIEEKHRQNLRDDELRKKSQREEEEQKLRKNREAEERAQRLEKEQEERRRRAQRERDEERQRFIKSEEEEQRRFVQKQQEEQRFQRQREIERQRESESQRELERQKNLDKKRADEEQNRQERLRQQFDHDQWNIPQQTRQNNSGSNVNTGGYHRTAFSNNSNPNYLPLGERRNLSSKPATVNYAGTKPYGNADYSVMPPEQVRRDPARDTTCSTNSASISKATKPMDQDDWLNTEWEEFSKSLEQPTFTPPSSFLNFSQKRPVAPVAPSQKGHVLRNPQPLYSNDPPPPPPPPQFLRVQPYQGVTEPAGATSFGVTAKGPLRYENQEVNVLYPDNSQSMRRQSSEHAESESSTDTTSSDEEVDDEELEEEESGPQLSSRLHNPYPVQKMTLCPFIANLFCEAVESKDFAYGIQGKLQTLFLQFMKEFNNRFWKKCFGFEIELDPTYQDTTPADYAKFGDRKSTQMTDLLNSVPCFEENFITTFFCQSAGKLSTLLTHAAADLRSGKFIRKQSGPMLKVLMDEVPAHLVSSNQNLRFKVEVCIVLDYSNLNKQCRPYVKILFEKGFSTQNEMLTLFRFFGKLYSKMGTRFLNYCFKRWLASCVDFDIKAAERKCMLLKHQNIESGKALTKKERRRLRRLKRTEKKKQKKMMEFQATSWAASALPSRTNSVGSGSSGGFGLPQATNDNRRYEMEEDFIGSASYGNSTMRIQQTERMQFQPEQRGSRGARFVPGRGKTFQVPPNWTRSMSFSNPNSTPTYRRQF